MNVEKCSTINAPGRISVFIRLLICISGFLASAISLGQSGQDTLTQNLLAIGQDQKNNYRQLGQLRYFQISTSLKTVDSMQLYKNSCYRFAAAGEEKLDSVLLKLSHNQRVLKQSKPNGTSTWLIHCPKKDQRVNIGLRSKKNAGKAAYAVFAQSGEIYLIDNQEQMVRQKIEELSKDNPAHFTAASAVFSGYLRHRSKDRQKVNLTAGKCYKIVTATGSKTIDMSLSVLIDDKEVISNRLAGIDPFVNWCSPITGAVTVEVAMYNGSGAYAFRVYANEKKAGEAPEIVGGLESDFIANRIRQLHLQFGQGRAAISGVFRGNLQNATESEDTISLLGGHCYTILAVGLPSVENLDLLLLNQGNRKISEDDSQNGYPVLNTTPCVKKSGIYKIKVRMAKGHGSYGYQIFAD